MRETKHTVSFPTTALSCEATKEYSPCVALCGQTCQDLASPAACGAGGSSDLSGDECVEGCTCPPDTYLIPRLTSVSLGEQTNLTSVWKEGWGEG